MKRNTLFGGLALLGAGGVIGAGAMISASAMADDAGTPRADEVTIVQVTTDGEAVQCTFAGPDVEGLLPDLLGVAPDQALPVDGEFTTSGSGVIEVAVGDLPEGVLVASGAVTVSAEGTVGDVGELPSLDSLDSLPIDNMQVVSVDDAREGTAEECAAMRAQAQAGATGAEGAEGVTSMVIGSAGVIVNEP